jgi:DNA-binding MarR family transcriptional regulator
MPLLMLKDLPRYESLLAAARDFPDLDPSATEVFLTLLRTGDEAFRVVEEHLAKHEITQGGFSVLMALWSNCRRCGENLPLSPAVLAERTSVTRATMTGLVDTLERAGLVQRAPDLSDRRMLSIGLTGRGENILHEILPGHFRRMAWLMGPLSEADRNHLVRLLSKVLARAGESGEHPATAGVGATTVGEP